MEGLRRAGQTGDNYLDVVSLIIQEAIFPGTSPRCESPSLATLDLNDGLHRTIYGTNNTVVVGLTETMFASTDGYNVVYYSTAKRVVQSEVALGAWPIPVDVRMGIAAVRYGDNSGEESDDTGHGKTTSMMGCRCDDDPITTTMHITCAILHYDPGSSEANNTLSDPKVSVFPVVFQVPSTAQYMQCKSTKINVESIRWPNTRFTSIQSAKLPLLNQLKGSDCMETGKCSQADAAVWVMPLCGGGAPPAVCYLAFVSAACYPYCMGLRQSGSYNSVMRLYNAPNWWDRVHIFNMDCALMNNNPKEDSTKSSTGTIHKFADSVISGLDASQKASLDSILSNLNYGGASDYLSNSVAASSSASDTSDTTITNDWITSSTTAPVTYFPTNVNGVYDSSAKCVHNSLARSSMPTAIFQSLNGNYGESNFRSTLGPGQPFVFAGDTVLTAECEDIDINAPDVPPPCKVLVHRIYGSETNQFTLVRVYKISLLKKPHTTMLPGRNIPTLVRCASSRIP